ncbi:MAG TPA: leucine-rich repeat domain-containing protein, partial [Candidatus Obscuribacterales bacterium]
MKLIKYILLTLLLVAIASRTATPAEPTFLQLCQGHNQLSAASQITLTALLQSQQTDDCGVANDRLGSATQLTLNNYHLQDLSLLAYFPQLQQLYLANNQITDINSLSTLTNLRTLALSHNQVAEIAALAAMPQLQTLYLNGNRIQEISSLATLNQLSYLDLSD